jgi:hypothetical protein
MALQEYRNLKKVTADSSNVSWIELKRHFDNLFIDDDDALKIN